MNELFKTEGEILWQMVSTALALVCLALIAFLIGSLRKAKKFRDQIPPPPRDEPEPQGVVGKAGIVDEKDRQVEAVRQLEGRCQFFFEESQTYNMVIGMDGKLTDLNRAFLNIFDKEKAELVGRDPVELVAPEQREEFSKYVTRHLEDKFTSHLEVDFPGKAEPRKIMLGERHVTIVKNFVPTAILITGVDVTHLRRSEEKEGVLKKQLALTARMETLGILAGGVAHDLKNLFSPLLSYPEFIKNQLPPDSPLRTPLDRIEQSASRSLEVIQNFLTLARRGKYELEPMDINNVIETYLESADLNELRHRHPEVTVKTNLARNLPLIEGLSAQMMNVIMNLARNACEAMPSGGKLEIATYRKKLEFPHKGYQQIPSGDYVVVEVSDEGTGMEKEELGSIFTPFASKKKMGRSGSGLGTVIISGVIADHHGYLDIDTKVGKGTKFSVYLRALKETAGRQKQVSGGSETVLVVDNSKDDKELADHLLSGLGYRVESVESGAETLEYVKKNPVDIIVLDIVLDDLNGLDIYSKILEFKPEQKVVVVSSYWNPGDREKASRLGITQCLEKPISRGKIGRAVREELDKK